MLARAEELGVGDDLRLLAEVDAVNLRRQRWAVELTRLACGGDLSGKRIGVWGLSFKPGIDDIRDSPAIAVALAIHSHGALVSACDPVASDMVRTQHPELNVTRDPFAAAARSHAIVHLTTWPQFAEIRPDELRQRVSAPIMVDARAALDPQVWIEAGWTYLALGRPVKAPEPMLTAAPAAQRGTFAKAPSCTSITA